MPEGKKVGIFKKQFSDFMRDESGKMTRENALKVGVGMIGVLGALSSFEDVHAQHSSHSSHYSGSDYTHLKRVGASQDYDDWQAQVHSNWPHHSYRHDSY